METILRHQTAPTSRSRTMDRLLLLKELIHSLFTKTPPQLIQSFDSQEMKLKIAEIMDANQFDLLQVDFTQMAGYLPDNCAIPSILVEHDVLFNKQRRLFQATSSPLIKVQALIDYFKVKKFELEACKRYTKIVTMSDEDRNLLLDCLPDLNITVIPNGVDANYFKTIHRTKDSREKESKDIVFVGWFRHTPNLDAVNYFYDKIFPLIKEAIPSCRFWIIGKYGPETLEHLVNDKNVVVPGYVEDIRPYLANCAVFVVPLRIAGGTRLKILEAMASGCAIVSTSVGAEGLEATDKKDILIGDTPKEFAEAVIKIIKDDDLRERLCRNARKLIESKYDWDNIAHIHNDLYFELAERREDEKQNNMSRIPTTVS